MPTVGDRPPFEPIADAPPWPLQRRVTWGSRRSVEDASAPFPIDAVRPDVAGAIALDAPADRLSAGITPSVATVSAPLTGGRGDLFDLADRLAAQLDEEADLRGVRR